MKHMLCAAVLLASVYVYCPGQIAFWDFENICGPLPCLPIPASLTTTGVSWAWADMVGGANSGSPPVCTGQETWATNFWPSTPYPQDEYLSFTVEALPGYELDILSFYFSSSASSSNSALSYDLYYLINGSNAVFMGSGQHTPGSCTGHAYPQSIFVPSGGYVEFRLYPYGQNPAARVATIRLDDVWLEGSAPLPAELLFFRGRPADGKILLEWAFGTTDQTEVFIDRFEAQEFRQINRLQECQSVMPCQWVDPAPLPGDNIYRLRRQALTGDTEIYPPIVVRLESPIRLHSNVISGNTLTILLPPNGRFSLDIFDASGGIHWTGKAEGGAVRIPLGTMRKGVGWVRYSGSSSQGILPFVRAGPGF
jgi:hypothetical protein